MTSPQFLSTPEKAHWEDTSSQTWFFSILSPNCGEAGQRQGIVNEQECFSTACLCSVTRRHGGVSYHIISSTPNSISLKFISVQKGKENTKKTRRGKRYSEIHATEEAYVPAVLILGINNSTKYYSNYYTLVKSQQCTLAQLLPILQLPLINKTQFPVLNLLFKS